jgi:hypothetical protein
VVSSYDTVAAENRSHRKTYKLIGRLISALPCIVLALRRQFHLRFSPSGSRAVSVSLTLVERVAFFLHIRRMSDDRLRDHPHTKPIADLWLYIMA